MLCMPRRPALVAVAIVLALDAAAHAAAPDPAQTLAELVAAFGEVETPTRGADEFEAAANAFVEVQRDSQSPSPPGREIIGEKVILELRDAYARRMGEHYRPIHFHQALLRHGELPLPIIRRLMLGD